MPRTTAPRPDPSAADTEVKELRKRIERLEERIDESILGDDGLARLDTSPDAGLDSGIDKGASGDALRKAVQRSNVRRGSRKV